MIKKVFKSVKLLMVLAVIPVAKMHAANETEGAGKLELTSSEQQLVDKNNGFAFRLFGKADNCTSMVISPLSITYALSMLNNGATGQTQKEINDVLGFGDASMKTVNDLCHKMMTQCPVLDPLTQVSTANAVFVNQDYQLKPAFMETAQASYDATLENRDFADGRTLDAINLWAGSHTNQMIPKILSESEFDPQAVSYLLNATYFKGAWTQKFDPSQTRSEAFGTSGELIDMMHLRDNMYYAENATYQALRLPYGNKSFYMTMLLPREDKTVADIVAAIDGEHWRTAPTFGIDEVDIKLPKMDVETGLQLNQILVELGIQRAFEPKAEFSEFCDRNTYLSLMKQEARLKMDEEGTEAAAVTVGILPPSFESKTYEFHANRPFLFVISEANSGLILFIGQYAGIAKKNNTTGIQSYKSPMSKSAVYDLQGRRVTATRGNVSIVNGRKGIRGFLRQSQE